MSSSVNEWYVFEAGSIDKKTCNKIKKLAQGKWTPAGVDISGQTSAEERITGKVQVFKPDPTFRISDIFWSNEQWIYDLIFPFMRVANEKAGWHYDVRSAESAQITRYKKGEYYNFHRDGHGCHMSTFDNPDNEFFHGNVRKLSMSVMLNDNFEGGAFEFASYGKTEYTITPIEATAGSVIVFPSSMEHRVAPVTKGTRYSIVCWFLGPPFK